MHPHDTRGAQAFISSLLQKFVEAVRREVGPPSGGGPA
jgi:hypothetical protein